MANVKVFMLKFCDKGQGQGQGGHKFQCAWKGVATSNTHVKYESPKSKGAEVMTNVKVFCDRQTNKQTDKQTEQKQYAPIFSKQGA